VHGDFGGVLCLEISAIVGMVNVSMCQDDELELSRPAACAGQFLLQGGAFA